MEFKRCGILIVSLFGLRMIATAVAPTSSPAFQKVILISVDTLRADYLGCYDSRKKTSPALDQFASENILFRNVTSQSATTAPSHKSIFYSVYPSIHKTSIRGVPQEKGKSPVELLRGLGFKTAAFTGGGQLSHSFGFAKGFETYQEPKAELEIKKGLQLTQKLGLDWLEKHSNDKFFLFLHTYEVHCPYDPPDLFFQKWSAWYEGLIRKTNTCFPNLFSPRRLTEIDYKYIQSLYSAEVNYIDSFLGNLFRKLKILGIYDQALIIFLSDHGESLGEHGYIGHNQLYQVQLHVPLIVRIPGVPAARIDAPVESLDVMPTIFELVGNGTDGYGFQGKSVIPLVRKPAEFDQNRPLISEEMERVRVRIRDLVLIFSPDGKFPEQLYDLKKDPNELQNIAHENPKVVEQMKLPYFQMMARSKALSAQFVLVPGRNPDMSEETMEQLKSLGYVQN